MNEIQTTNFDFSEIADLTLRGRVIDRDIRFESEKKIVEGGLVNMGKLLTEQKADLGHGLWMKWLEAKGISQSSAKRLMQISEKFSNRPHVGDLGIRVLSLLAQDNTPESAREEVIAKAENGEKVTYADAQELVKAKRMIESLETQLKAAMSQTASLSAINQIDVLQQKLKEKIAFLNGSRWEYV